MPPQKLSLGPNTLEQVPAEQRLEPPVPYQQHIAREFVVKDFRAHGRARVIDSAAMKREVPQHTRRVKLTICRSATYLGQFPTEAQALFWESDILLLLYLGPGVF